MSRLMEWLLLPVLLLIVSVIAVGLTMLGVLYISLASLAVCLFVLGRTQLRRLREREKPSEWQDSGLDRVVDPSSGSTLMRSIRSGTKKWM